MAVITNEPQNFWERHLLVVDQLAQRLERIIQSLQAKNVRYALVGGQAVNMWIATKDPGGGRQTKDIDILLDRCDVHLAKAAALAVGMDYFETVGVGMLLEKADPNPRTGVHILWSNEKVRWDSLMPAPSVDERIELLPGVYVVPLAALVCMKLIANRDQDRTHLRDMIDVDLIDRSMLAGLPAELAARLDALLTDEGR